MPIKQAAKAKSVAWTGAGSPTSPMTDLQSWSFTRNTELVEFLSGASRVNSHYAGTKDAEITVESADLAKLAYFEVGMKLSNVVLTVESALDSAGTAVGSDVLISLSKAVVSAVGELGRDNAAADPIVGSVTFKLSKHQTDDADPTWTISAGG